MRLLLACALACTSCTAGGPTPAPWDGSRLVDADTLEIAYTRSSGDGCGEAEAAEVSYGESQVTVRLLVDNSTEVCPANAVPDTFAVTLEEPLRGRPVVDAERGGG